jgi:hypothetical protein
MFNKYPKTMTARAEYDDSSTDCRHCSNDIWIDRLKQERGTQKHIFSRFVSRIVINKQTFEEMIRKLIKKKSDGDGPWARTDVVFDFHSIPWHVGLHDDASAALLLGSRASTGLRVATIDLPHEVVEHLKHSSFYKRKIGKEKLERAKR